jgi:hypothetical protein
MVPRVRFSPPNYKMLKIDQLLFPNEQAKNKAMSNIFVREYSVESLILMMSANPDGKGPPIPIRFHGTHPRSKSAWQKVVVVDDSNRASPGAFLVNYDPKRCKCFQVPLEQQWPRPIAESVRPICFVMEYTYIDDAVFFAARATVDPCKP